LFSGGQLLRDDDSSAPLPPLDYLRDPLILREHLRHILGTGWTSRTQFESEYVNLLTLLHNLAEDYFPPSGEGSFGGNSPATTTTLPSEEVKERNRCICLVVKGNDDKDKASRHASPNFRHFLTKILSDNLISFLDSITCLLDLYLCLLDLFHAC